MKRWYVILAVGLFGLQFFGGCQSRRCNNDDVSGGHEKFPEFLAGTWKADEGNWQVTLMPDGSVASAVTYGGLALPVAEGRKYMKGPLAEEFIYMEYGPSHAGYSPSTRELAVTIRLDRILMGASTGESLDMYIKYYLKGRVSPDGRQWYAEMLTSGGSEGIDPNDPNNVRSESLVFTRVEGN